MLVGRKKEAVLRKLRKIAESMKCNLEAAKKL